MKPEAGMFFQEPLDLLKKHQTQMRRLLEFQRNHRTRLVSFHRKMLLRCKEMERQCKLAAERMQQLEKENIKLKDLLNSGVGGGGEYGVMGGSSHPHESYQRAITASAMRNSPQGSQIHPASTGSRLLSGRITLMKGKAGSPANRISPNMQSDDKLKGRPPAHQMLMKGSSFPYSSQSSPSNDIVTPMFASPDISRISPYSRNVMNGNRYYSREESPLSQHVGSQSLAYSQSKKIAPLQMQECFNYKSRSPNQLFLSQEILGVPKNYSSSMKTYPRY